MRGFPVHFNKHEYTKGIDHAREYLYGRRSRPAKNTFSYKRGWSFCLLVHSSQCLILFENGTVWTRHFDLRMALEVARGFGQAWQLVTVLKDRRVAVAQSGDWSDEKYNRHQTKIEAQKEKTPA